MNSTKKSRARLEVGKFYSDGGGTTVFKVTERLEDFIDDYLWPGAPAVIKHLDERNKRFYFQVTVVFDSAVDVNPDDHGHQKKLVPRVEKKLDNENWYEFSVLDLGVLYNGLALLAREMLK